MADKIKDVTIKFKTETDEVRKANADFDALNKKIQQTGANATKANAEYLTAAQKRQQNLQNEIALLADLESKRKKAFDADSIRAYNDDIKKVKDNIALLKGEISNAEKSSGNFLGTLKGVAGAMGLAFGVQQLVSFGKEAVNLAAKGEGIRIAFAKIGNDKSLEKLREATRGTVSDIDLMSKALKANDFKISTELLAKGFEYAGKQAVRTGQDVDYLVDSLVNGIGRKSTLVLDNLGISASELQEEVKKLGGDFNEAVGNIINRRLGEMGEVTETTKTKIDRLSASWDNFKEKAGEAIIDAADGLVNLGEQLTEFGGDISSFMEQDYVKEFSEFLVSIFSSGEDKKFVKATEEELKNLDKALANFTELQKNRGEESGKVPEEIQKKLLKNTVESHNKEKAIVKEKRKLTEEELEAIAKAIEEEQKRKDEAIRHEINSNAQKFDQLNKLRLDALKIANQRELLEVEEGSDEELQIKIANAERIRDFRIATEVEYQQDEINIREQTENEILELKRSYDEKWFAEKAKNDEEYYKDQKKKADKAAKEELERRKQLLDAQFGVASEFIQATAEILDNNAKYQEALIDRTQEKKLAAIDEELNQEHLSEEEKASLLKERAKIEEDYEKQKLELKRQEAKREKAEALFNIALETAKAIVANLKTPALIPFVIAAGALQEAAVLSRPIPFAKGVIDLQKGRGGIDDVPAVLMRGESVMTTEETSKHKDLFQAIRNDYFEKYIDENYVNPKIEKFIHYSGDNKHNIAQAIELDFDEYKLSRVFRRNKGVVVENMPRNGISDHEYNLRRRRGLNG